MRLIRKSCYVLVLFCMYKKEKENDRSCVALSILAVDSTDDRYTVRHVLVCRHLLLHHRGIEQDFYSLSRRLTALQLWMILYAIMIYALNRMFYEYSKSYVLCKCVAVIADSLFCVLFLIYMMKYNDMSNEILKCDAITFKLKIRII